MASGPDDDLGAFDVIGTDEALRQLAAEDDDFCRSFDAVVAGCVARHSGLVLCRIGCTECCYGPFDITALDAFRLRRGLASLGARNGKAAARLARRAVRQWRMFRRAFPGDPASGRLSDDQEARLAFFSRFQTQPCPLLEKADGHCLLYAFRPLSCRSFGIPVRCGEEVLAPCHLNFVGVRVEVVQATAVDPDPHDREGVLLQKLAALTGERGETVVAAALALAGVLVEGGPTARAARRGAARIRPPQGPSPR